MMRRLGPPRLGSQILGNARSLPARSASRRCAGRRASAAALPSASAALDVVLAISRDLGAATSLRELLCAALRGAARLGQVSLAQVAADTRTIPRPVARACRICPAMVINAFEMVIDGPR